MGSRNFKKTLNMFMKASLIENIQQQSLYSSMYRITKTKSTPAKQLEDRHPSNHSQIIKNRNNSIMLKPCLKKKFNAKENSQQKKIRFVEGSQINKNPCFPHNNLRIRISSFKSRNNQEETKNHSKNNYQKALELGRFFDGDSFSYYRQDVRKIVKMGDQAQNSKQFKHIQMGIDATKVFFPKETQNKKFGQPSKLRISLKKNQDRSKIIILFDLEQTLIHTLKQDVCDSYQDKEELYIEGENGQLNLFYVNIRPYAKELLKILSRSPFFDVGIFTQINKSYADKIIHFLDPLDTIFTQKYYKQHCQINSRYCVKNLQILKNCCLSQTILVDNSPYSYLHQPENAVPILPFTSDSDDLQLRKLQKFLMNSIYEKKKKSKNFDVRTVLREYFKLSDFKRFRSPRKLVHQLYE